jgi:hypothetical protein
MRRASLFIALWILDLALIGAALVLRPLGIDIFLTSTYYVIPLNHVILAVWLVFTIPLAVISIWRVREQQKT